MLGPRGPRRRFLASAVAAWLVAVIALACLASGSVYQWCVPMARAMDTCCCDHHAGEEVDGAAVRRVCCEDRMVDAVPAAQAERNEGVAAPLATASILDTREVDVLRVVPGRLRLEHRTQHRPRRARPPPLTTKLAMLQVYRC